MKKNYFLTLGLATAALLSAIATAQTTFNYTGALQTYVVPAGVTSVAIDCIAGSGGYHYDSGLGYPQIPGDGGRVETVLTVTPGATLNIYVGGVGESPTSPILAAGGYNGGGGGGNGFGMYSGGGGGGASDIRIGGTALSDRVVVAGGGGGGAVNYGSGDDGGNGGDLIGADGMSGGGPGMGYHGVGGNQVTGGAGGVIGGYVSGTAGSLGLGGFGGTDGSGGGGGGYYGGGGGAWAGGGGASSYTDAVLCSGTVHTQGYNVGDGMVVITELCLGLTTSVSATDVCDGETVTLSASSTGSGTVTWDGGVTDGVAFTPPVGTTTYTATSDDPGDCAFSVDITVNPLPTVDGGSDVDACEGDVVTLSGSGTADSYSWDGGITDGLAFTPGAGTTTFTVTGTITATGCEDTDVVDVNYTLVDEGVTVTGATITSDQAGATYQWIDCFDLSDIAGETNQAFTATQSGDYAVIVTVNGCEDTSACENINGVGMSSEENAALMVYPNPANKEVTISLPGSFLYELRTLTGALIAQGTGVGTHTLQLNNVSAGTYLVTVIHNDSVKNIQLVVK